MNSEEYRVIKFHPKWPKLPNGYRVVWFDDRMFAEVDGELAITACDRFWLRKWCFANYAQKAKP